MAAEAPAQSCTGTTDVVCTNSGPAGIIDDSVTGATNLTSINTVTGTATSMRAVTDVGNLMLINDGAVSGPLRGNAGSFVVHSRATATVVNNGTAAGIRVGTDDGGDAIAENNGYSSGSVIVTINGIDAFGTARISNRGTATVLTARNDAVGDAVVINSGTALSFISATNASGTNSLVINSGQVVSISTTNGFGLSGTGSAKTINSGIVTGTIDTVGPQTLSGEAITDNSGFVGGDITTTDRSNSGMATTTNQASGVAGNITTTAGQFGTAMTINMGRANNLASVASAGAAGVVNAGFAGSVSASSDTGPASVANSGSIRGTVAATSNSGPASIINSGSIVGTVQVTSSYNGAAGPGSFLTNAGLIDGRGEYAAIDLTSPGARMTLNLLAGSHVMGRILISGDQADPANVPTNINIQGGRGTSSILTFGDGTGTFGLADTGARVNVTNAPYVVSGNSVVIVDPSSFAATSRNMVDFVHAIGALATGRLSSPAPPSSDGVAIGFAPTGNVARDMIDDAFASLAIAGQDRILAGNPNLTAADGTSVWAQGFGGRRVGPEDSSTLRSINNFFGGAIGADRTVQPGLRLGAFIGGGNLQSDLDLNAGRTTSNLVFAGVYGRYALNGGFADVSLLGGGSDNSSSRRIENNLAPGGVEYAQAKYAGWFISPEIAFGFDRPVGNSMTLTPAVRLRYLAAGFGGYQESGSAAGLAVASRVAHYLEERIGTALTRRFDGVAHGVLQMTGTAGLVSLQRAGDSGVNAVLLGQSLAFATPGEGSLIGYYAGAGIDWHHAKGLSIFAATEFTGMSDSSRTLTGRGGIRIAF